MCRRFLKLVDTVPWRRVDVHCSLVIIVWISGTTVLCGCRKVICPLFYMTVTCLLYVLYRWKIIINNVPGNLGSVNIIQWVVQLRYSILKVFSTFSVHVTFSG